jgi:hypothetical protein
MICAILTALLVSLGLGQCATFIFIDLSRHYLGLKALKGKLARSAVPGWLTGTVERLFFTILVWQNVSGIPAGTMAWLALKFVTNWNHKSMEVEGVIRKARRRNLNTRSNAMLALLAGLMSMLFAYAGGEVLKAMWPRACEPPSSG